MAPTAEERCESPSHGYRAVHAVYKGSTGSIEAQIRTFLQHQWAELGERWDRIHPGTKYGEGRSEVTNMLNGLSKSIVEALQLRNARGKCQIADPFAQIEHVRAQNQQNLAPITVLHATLNRTPRIGRSVSTCGARLMSLFVLIYDRAKQRLVGLREFPESDREAAETFRLDAQRRSLREDLDQEIVLFQAASRESLMRTHGSYFLSERELLERMRDAAEAS